MADKDEKKEGLTSISDDEAITEIDFGSFLAEGDSGSSVAEDLHSDIENIEASLNNAIQGLYDTIMSSGPETVVPKTMSEITSKEEKDSSPLGEMWMNPAEYIDMSVPAEKREPISEEESAKAKDDIFGLIEDLKTSTDSETGFDDILASIESNEGISPVSTVDEAAKLADFTPKSLDELDELLGEDNEAQEEAPEAAPAPVSSTEEAKAEYLGAALDPNHPHDSGSLPELNSSNGIFPDDIDAADDLPMRERRKANKAAKKQEKEEIKEAKSEKNNTTKEIIRKVVLTLSIITIIVSVGILANQYIIQPKLFEKNQKEMEDIVSVDSDEDPTGVIDENYSDESDDTEYPEGMMLKYKKLYAINNDLAGWISIPGLSINLPIVQGDDNSYYLKRNFYKKWTDYGVPFFDYRVEDLKNLPKNLVVYGHNMRYDSKIFGTLENYYEPDTFKSNPVIQCDTIYGTHTWFVYAVFITNSNASQDNGYLFPYNFVELSNSQFAEYITELDKRKLYSTGVDILPTDNILTLSTCCYDFDEARFVVVAREQREGESATPDTSNVVKNDNPRYPQAWYKAYGKTNPYANDTNWEP